MPAITITLEQLDALRPCARRRDVMAAALDWSTPVDAARAVAARATLEDIVWVAAMLARHDPEVERRLYLWAADCAARALHVFERECPTDMRPRDAIVASRRYARGEIDATTAAAAREAAWAANWGAAVGATGDAAWAARAAACPTFGDAAWSAAWAAAKAGWVAEERWQLDRLVAWLSADEPEDWPLPPRPTEAKRAFDKIAEGLNDAIAIVKEGKAPAKLFPPTE